MIRKLLLVLVAISTLVVPTTLAQTQQRVIAFVNVNVVPFDRERILEGQTVIVVDGRISQIVPADKTKLPAGTLEIDGRGKYLMPGPADMHAHLYPGTGQADDLASQQLQLFLANGVTTIRNMIGKQEHLALRERVAKGELPGPSIYTAGPPLLGNNVPTPEAAEQVVTEQKKAGYDLLKVHEGLSPETSREFGTVEVGLRADLLLLDANPLQSVANLSKRVGLMVRGRWLPESELRKMLENVARLNQQNPEASTAKVGFSGTWALDKANSEGLPPGMDQLMTVTHTGDKLSLETKLITEQGEQVVPDSYMLDGKEVEFTPKGLGGQTGKGKRTAKLGADGNSIEVSETATFDGPEGAVTVQATRKWMLSADGKTLKIEMTVDGPNGKQVIKRTFIRK